MSADEARNLLGGYATGTLTPEEQQALFAAALEDQDLFDALAREQALKEALDDPAVRAEMLNAVTARKRGWLGWWPALAGASAVALVTLTVMMLNRPTPKAVIVAENRQEDRVGGAVPQFQKLDASNAPVSKAKARVPETEYLRKTSPAKKTEGPAATLPVRTLSTPLSEPGADALAEPSQVTVGTLSAARTPPAAAPSIQGAAAAFPLLAQQLFEAPSLSPPAAQSHLLRDRAVGGAAMERAHAPVGKADIGPVTSPFHGLGLRYSITRDGALTAEANLAGFLRVFRRAADGIWTPAASELAVTAHTPVTVQTGMGAEIAVVLSRQSIPPLNATGLALTRAIDDLRTAQPALVTGSNGNVQFAVEPTQASNAVLIVMIGAGPR